VVENSAAHPGAATAATATAYESAVATTEATDADRTTVPSTSAETAVAAFPVGSTTAATEAASGAIAQRGATSANAAARTLNATPAEAAAVAAILRGWKGWGATTGAVATHARVASRRATKTAESGSRATAVAARQGVDPGLAVFKGSEPAAAAVGAAGATA
jgi:hypothetical protein